jgi:hypothetical protein
MVRSYSKTGKIGASKPKSKDKAIKQATAIALAEAGKSRKPVKAKEGGAFMVVKKKDGNRPVKILLSLSDGGFEPSALHGKTMLQYTEALLREIRKLRADTEAIVLNGTITDMERYRFLMGRLEGLKLSEDAARNLAAKYTSDL